MLKLETVKRYRDKKGRTRCVLCTQMCACLSVWPACALLIIFTLLLYKAGGQHLKETEEYPAGLGMCVGLA